MATALQGISGLYITLYNRAADSAGQAFWASILGETVAQAATTTITAAQMQTLSASFINTQSSYFNATYGSLTDTQFVQALYQNLGGNSGDTAGITFWVSQLAGGQTRAQVVGRFVNDFISLDLSTKPAGLSDADYQAALARQHTFQNKILVSLNYAANSSALLIPKTTTDDAFGAATRVIQGVTADDATRDAANAQIPAAVAANDLTLITGGGAVGVNLKIGTDIATANHFIGLPDVSALGITVDTVNFTDQLTGSGKNPALDFSSVGTNINVSPTLSGVTNVNFKDILGFAGLNGMSLANSTGVTALSIDETASLVSGGGVSGVAIIGAKSTLVGDKGSISISGASGQNVLGAAPAANGSGVRTLILFDGTALAGGSDTVNLTLNNMGGSQATSMRAGINIAGDSVGAAETIAVTAVGTNRIQFLESDPTVTTLAGVGAAAPSINSGMKTLKVLGDGFLRIEQQLTNVTTVDASANKGGVTLVLDATKDVSVTGGAGNDNILFGAGLTNADKYDGGAGRDTIRVSDAAGIIAGNQITNVEILRNDAVAGAPTFDMSLVSSFDTINHQATVASIYNNFSAAGFADATKGVIIGDTGPITVTTKLADGSLATDAFNISDVGFIQIGNTSTNAPSALQGGTALGPALAAGAISVAGIETLTELVNVNPLNGATATAQGLITDLQLQSLTINGGATGHGAVGVGASASPIYIAGALIPFGGFGGNLGAETFAIGTIPVKLDAGAFQGNISLGAGHLAGVGGLTTGGVGGQVVIGGLGDDVIDGNGRAAFTGAATPTNGDTLKGGAGNDIFLLNNFDNGGAAFHQNDSVGTFTAATGVNDPAFAAGGYYTTVTSFTTADLATFTSIVDLNLGGNGSSGGVAGDKVDLFTFGAAPFTVVNGGSVTALTGANFAAAVNALFGAGGALNNAAATAAAGLFSFGAETFLAATNATAGGFAGYDSSVDLIVRVTGVVGTFDNTDII